MSTGTTNIRAIVRRSRRICRNSLRIIAFNANLLDAPVGDDGIQQMLSSGIVAHPSSGRFSGPTRHNDPVMVTDRLPSDGERPAGCPSSAVDLWSDAVLADPYPVFAELRAAGP